MSKILFALSLGFGLCILAQAANSQESKCGPRDEFLKVLAENYKESRQMIGLIPGKGILETYASEVTGHWTIIMNFPNGLTCLIANGTHFEKLNETLPKKSSNT